MRALDGRRALVLLVAALILPSLAVVAFGLGMIAQERELSANRRHGRGATCRRHYTPDGGCSVSRFGQDLAHDFPLLRPFVDRTASEEAPGVDAPSRQTQPGAREPAPVVCGQSRVARGRARRQMGKQVARGAKKPAPPPARPSDSITTRPGAVVHCAIFRAWRSRLRQHWRRARGGRLWARCRRV